MKLSSTTFLVLIFTTIVAVGNAFPLHSFQIRRSDILLDALHPPAPNPVVDVSVAFFDKKGNPVTVDNQLANFIFTDLDKFLLSLADTVKKSEKKETDECKKRLDADKTKSDERKSALLKTLIAALNKEFEKGFLEPISNTVQTHVEHLWEEKASKTEKSNVIVNTCVEVDQFYIPRKSGMLSGLFGPKDGRDKAIAGVKKFSQPHLSEDISFFISSSPAFEENHRYIDEPSCDFPVCLKFSKGLDSEIYPMVFSRALSKIREIDLKPVKEKVRKCDDEIAKAVKTGKAKEIDGLIKKTNQELATFFKTTQDKIAGHLTETVRKFLSGKGQEFEGKLDFSIFFNRPGNIGAAYDFNPTAKFPYQISDFKLLTVDCIAVLKSANSAMGSLKIKKEALDKSIADYFTSFQNAVKANKTPGQFLADDFQTRVFDGVSRQLKEFIPACETIRNNLRNLQRAVSEYLLTISSENEPLFIKGKSFLDRVSDTCAGFFEVEYLHMRLYRHRENLVVAGLHPETDTVEMMKELESQLEGITHFFIPSEELFEKAMPAANEFNKVAGN